MAENLQKIGLEYEEQGNFGKAIETLYHALTFEPDNQKLWMHFARLFRFVQFSNYDERLKIALTRCLEQPIGNHQDLVYASISLIKLMPPFQLLFQTIEESNIAMIKEMIYTGEIFKVLSDPLFLKLIEKTILPDPKIEKLLTIFRKQCLEAFFNHKLQIDDPKVAAFVYSLSLQCFLNEYIYDFSMQEQEHLDALCNNVDWNWEELDEEKKIRIALIGCYLPLYTLNKNPRLKAKDGFYELLHRQIFEPLEQLQYKIPLQGVIKNEVSLKVKKQYEASPYPRWTSLNDYEATTVADFLKKSFPHAEVDKRLFSENSRILIAGCGTGQHVFNTARQFKNRYVLGIDLSQTSLNYARWKAEKLKIPHVEFLQADILEWESPEKFDVIECTGVLHHLKDPLEGWIKLKKWLQPYGVMQIGLYSELARQDVVAACRLIQKHGYQPNDAGIRKCRQDLLNLPAGELAKNVTHAMDFYTMSSCRDLLFHVQEHRFNLLQIDKILKELNLKFIGFELRDKTLLNKYLSRFSDDPQATSLEHWHAFEQEHPQAFLGMYQFWVKNCQRTPSTVPSGI